MSVVLTCVTLPPGGYQHTCNDSLSHNVSSHVFNKMMVNIDKIAITAHLNQLKMFKLFF